MAHPHHHFHHKEAEQSVPVTDAAGVKSQGVGDIKAEIKHDKHKEHLGELGAVGAGAFAAYEKHKGKKDVENAHRHKIEEEIAVPAAVLAGGAAFHEHHNKKEAKQAEKEAEGKHKHHIF